MHQSYCEATSHKPALVHFSCDTACFVNPSPCRLLRVNYRYWAFARAACARRSDSHFRSYYLLGEMDRRCALMEKREGQHQGWRTKGASKQKW